MNPTRRDVLVTIAGLAGTPSDAQTGLLTPPEAAALKALVDTIMPRTDSPGASEAGVHTGIERRLAASPSLADRFRAGLKQLDADAQSRFNTGFAAATPQQQIDVLQARLEDPFFRLAKDMTVDLYYTSREGLTQELGWHGNTFLTEFKGCTHPDHQH